MKVLCCALMLLLGAASSGTAHAHGEKLTFKLSSIKTDHLVRVKGIPRLQSIAKIKILAEPGTVDQIAAMLKALKPESVGTKIKFDGGMALVKQRITVRANSEGEIKKAVDLVRELASK